MDIEQRRAPDWTLIDTVLLDLDGTLLDLAFDNHLWLDVLPRRYAAANNIDETAARAALAPRFRAWRGRLEWYDLDFWTRELGIDMAALHAEFAARIDWLPGAREFLGLLRARGKRLLLCTNSHPAALAVKDRRTGVLGLLDAAYTSHRFGAPKEDARFWRQLHEAARYDPPHTLLIDDNPAVLHAAAAAGIGWLVEVSEPDSTQRRGTTRAGVSRYF
ncbi:MAG: HAD-IA family hydrolase, partial [Steroidobacteraceae bacterium]|nr:HAD-IA family hydrolase [Steroidobacteraceae bacterium]